MRFKLSSAWPLGSVLVPSGTVIDASANDHWSKAAKGKVIPLSAVALDQEAWEAQLAAYPDHRHLLGGGLAMSFEEYSDCFIWRCNGGCGKEVLFKPHDFFACVAELRARGWSFHCDDEDRTWTHYCQRCRHKHQSVPLTDRYFSKPREVGK